MEVFCVRARCAVNIEVTDTRNCVTERERQLLPAVGNDDTDGNELRVMAPGQDGPGAVLPANGRGVLQRGHQRQAPQPLPRPPTREAEHVWSGVEYDRRLCHAGGRDHFQQRAHGGEHAARLVLPRERGHAHSADERHPGHPRGRTVPHGPPHGVRAARRSFLIRWG